MEAQGVWTNQGEGIEDVPNLRRWRVCLELNLQTSRRGITKSCLLLLPSTHPPPSTTNSTITAKDTKGIKTKTAKR